jgi:response regulator NasT
VAADTTPEGRVAELTAALEAERRRRGEAEAALRGAEARHRLLVESARVVVAAATAELAGAPAVRPRARPGDREEHRRGPRGADRLGGMPRPGGGDPAHPATEAAMSRRLRIAVADDERDTREFFQDLLPRLGHQVVAAAGGRQLAELCRVAEPDLVITDVKMPGADGLEAADEVNRSRPVPVILVSGHSSPELLARAGADYVMAYLTKPVKPADLETAIHLAVLRFERFQALRKEAAELRQALEDRKLIERAKGIVGRRLGVDEEEAFRLLRCEASDSNQKLAQVAQRVIDSDEVFRQLAKL